MILKVIAFEHIIAVIGILIFLALIGNVFNFVFRSIIRTGRRAGDFTLTALREKLHSIAHSPHHQYITGKIGYYDKLPDHLKLRFLLRVDQFIRAKKFSGRDMLTVTDEMKALIAGAAVQLTFGLKKYTLDFFSQIIIFPEAYYSPITKKKHIGEANTRGAIVISWKDFLKGFSIPGDTFNVGLHEMAHALELEKHLGGDYDEFFNAYYERWKLESETEYRKVSEDENSFFRKYAGTNRHEFFSVCVEYFFEATDEFKEKLPELYLQMCILLNQDPLNPDTSLKNVSRKMPVKSPDDLMVQPVIFETSKTRINFFQYIILIPLIIFMYFFKDIVASGLTIAVFALGFGFTFIRREQSGLIQLYSDYLCIRSHQGVVKALFPVDEIVSIIFEESGQELKISTVHNGAIVSREFHYSAKEGEIDELRKLLKGKKIFTRLGQV